MPQEAVLRRRHGSLLSGANATLVQRILLDQAEVFFWKCCCPFCNKHQDGSPARYALRVKLSYLEPSPTFLDRLPKQRTRRLGQSSFNAPFYLLSQILLGRHISLFFFLCLLFAFPHKVAGSASSTPCNRQLLALWMPWSADLRGGRCRNSSRVTGLSKRAVLLQLSRLVPVACTTTTHVCIGLR